MLQYFPLPKTHFFDFLTRSIAPITNFVLRLSSAENNVHKAVILYSEKVYGLLCLTQTRQYGYLVLFIDRLLQQNIFPGRLNYEYLKHTNFCAAVRDFLSAAYSFLFYEC